MLRKPSIVKVFDDSQTEPKPPLLIESMDLDAQGIAHTPDGRVVFC
jgi:hypothetical protein